MYVRICQAGLKIPLKNEIPAAGQKRREKARRYAALFLFVFAPLPEIPCGNCGKGRFLKSVILKSDKYRAHNGNIRGVHAKRQYSLPAADLLGYERRNENYRRNTQAHRQIEVNILRDKRHGFTADKRTERQNDA